MCIRDRLISTFAFSGVEMTFMASGEAINPRKTIPSSIKRTFSIVLTVYMLAIFAVGINIYSGDPRLLSYFAKYSSERYTSTINGIGTDWQLSDRCKGVYTEREHSTSHAIYTSPWVLALQSFGLCTFASALNGILIFFTSTAGVSSLYNLSLIHI